jgi:two-component system, chemotaxis family, sensor kinase CheA
MAGVDFNHFVEKFKDDSYKLLDELEEKLLELETDSTNMSLIESVFRTMHTLKGVGGMFGYDTISNYTHYLEDIYDKIRNNKLLLSKEIFNVTFSSVDHLRNLLEDRELSDANLQLQHKSLIAQIEKLIGGSTSIPGNKISSDKETENLNVKTNATWYIHFKCSEELIFRGVNIIYLFEDLAKLGNFTIEKIETPDDYNTYTGETWGVYLVTESDLNEIENIFDFVSDNVKILKIYGENLLSAESQSEINNASKQKSIFEAAQEMGEENGTGKSPDKLADQKSQDSLPVNKQNTISRISVGSDKLDKLMYLVSELFTTKSELIMATDAHDWGRVKMAAEKVEKLSNQFRNNALNIRLVPLKDLTQKFKRLIRDLSQSLNKKIEFVAVGDDTELDKNMVDALSDPFMHIIRNCIDHGIETPDVRLEKGKPESGTIKFIASQSGNYIKIQISDDGKGINANYIKRKAIEKNFISPDINLTEQEILELIFLPGFSTAESLSQVSGRGVGMDVVKKAITDLRGLIQIETQVDKGSSFSVRIQQSFSIMDTLLIKTGKTYFIIHVEDIEFCGIETHSQLFSKMNDFWQYGHELLPFVYLRSVFNIPGNAPEIEKIVVIKKQNQRFAIITDEIIGQYQAVLKPIGEIIKVQECITGASVIGDGNIALMLDIEKLSQKSLSRMPEHTEI